MLGVRRPDLIGCSEFMGVQVCSDRGGELWEIILEAGKPFGLAPGSPNRIRRIEGGVLDYGADILPADNPFEMGMGRFVDLDKPNFIGKTALAYIKTNGISRQMMGAFMDGAPFLKNNEHRWPVLSSSELVGEVTSAVHSPRLERNIGFVLADLAHTQVVRMLEVQTPEGRRALEDTTLPFIDPGKTIPRRRLR